MRKVLLISCIAISLPVFALVSGCGPSGLTTDQTIEESAGGNGAMDGAGSAEEPATAGMNVGADAAVRPGSVPDDLPNLAGAKNFGWLSIGGSEMFSYEMTGGDYRAVCAGQIDLLLSAGWRKSDAYEMDIDGALVTSFENPGYTLMITCGDNTEEGSAVTTVSVALNRSKK